MNAESLSGLDLSVFWSDSAWALKEYRDDPLTDDSLSQVEARLGYRLPRAYVELCRNRNGGEPRLTCHAVSTPTSYAPDHVAIRNIKAIGLRNKWSLGGQLGHFHRLGEWEYPPIGVYFGDCPSAGHDALCLDYRTLNADGEPGVVHVDQEFDYRITPVAPSFAAFLLGLREEEDFEF